MSSSKTSDGKRKAAGKVSGKPQIVATSQTSRFHVDTLTTLSTEIDLQTVNISIGQNDLLVDAHLRLKAGVHYALIGRNGEGKSTLLKAIADRLIPGISDNIRLLLVSQVEDDDDAASSDLLAGEVEGTHFDTELTVTQRVVKSDRRRERALAEQKILQNAHDTSTNINDIAHALFTVKLQRARDDLEEAQKIAQRRSGARGSQARKDLLKAEAAIAELEKRLAESDWGIPDSQITLEAAEMLDAVQSHLDAIDAGTTEARARSILLGLGFKKEQLDAKFTTLSGGWRSRCSLANALLQKPDILMLDEPTNYLDILSVSWLQKHLESVPSTVLVIAHDREFVDAIAQETIILRNKTLTYYDGNLTEYEQDQRVERKGKIRMKEALDKKRVAIEKTIEQGLRTAKATGDTNKARMAKSRQKKLDDRWGMEKNAKGHRFKLNDNAGYFFTSRQEIEIDELDKPIKLIIPDPEPLRFPGSLISASNVTFWYPRATTKVLDDVSITIHPGDRVGLVGKNGEGKSTLVKLLTGIGGLLPKKGTIERHPRLRLGYFDQHSVEALTSAEVAGTSALRYFLDTLQSASPSIDVDESAARACLGSFGLHGRTAVNPISTLSGGQKVRLALAIVVYPAPNLLVLDEVTTHLDKDTIVALIQALKKYTGAVLLVSHDRHFVRCVIEGDDAVPHSGDSESEESDVEDDTGQSSKKGMVYAVGPKGRVKELGGGMDDYAVVIEKQLRKLGLS